MTKTRERTGKGFPKRLIFTENGGVATLARVSANYTITLGTAECQLLGLTPGCDVSVVVNPDYSLTIRLYTTPEANEAKWAEKIAELEKEKETTP
jgi:hypothetical protein